MLLLSTPWCFSFSSILFLDFFFFFADCLCELWAIMKSSVQNILTCLTSCRHSRCTVEMFFQFVYRRSFQHWLLIRDVRRAGTRFCGLPDTDATLLRHRRHENYVAALRRTPEMFGKTNVSLFSWIQTGVFCCYLSISVWILNIITMWLPSTGQNPAIASEFCYWLMLVVGDAGCWWCKARLQ